MFSTVRYFIKSSITFLILFRRYFYNEFPQPDLVSAHTHIILVGSVMMMIMGVALWFFPKAEKNDRLYKPAVILWVYYILTISTAVRFFLQIYSSLASLTEILKFLITIVSFLQVAGIVVFFISIWGRIRSVGSHLREAKGERF